jgi:hypothetical protein
MCEFSVSIYPSFLGFKSNLFPLKLICKHFLHRGDVVFHKDYMLLTFSATKTILFAQRKLSIPLLTLQGHPVCPVTATCQILAMSSKLGIYELLFSFSTPFGKFAWTYDKNLNKV